MAWNISTAKRRALVKLQLRDKNGRWIEMGGGVKWYSSRLKKVISGTVVGTQGGNALVRLPKENPTHEPALVKVPAHNIAVIDAKTKISIPGKNAPADATPEFEKPKAVGLQPDKAGSFVKPSDSPEDWSIAETTDGRTYISRPDGAELYFPARSLDIGDEIIAMEGADPTKPFSMGKSWARKKTEAVNTNGPKMGTVVDINGDRYAVVQLADGVVIDDPKNPGQKTNKVTVGLSNSVIKATDGLKQALGGTFDDEGFSEEDGVDEEEVDSAEEANSDHVGREVPEDEEGVEEDPTADVEVDIAEATKAAEPGNEDADAPIREDEDPAAKAAADEDLARRVAEREEKRKALGDQYDENGLTDDENKMITAYERMANRAADKWDDEGAAKNFAKAEDLRATGKRRLGATKEEAESEKAEKPAEEPKKAPQSAPEPEEERQPALDDLEAPTEKSEAEKRYDKLHAEVRSVRFPGEDIQPNLDDPRIKAAESADQNAADSEREGIKPDTDEWYDIWNSTYASALEDSKSEADTQKRQQEQDTSAESEESEENAYEAARYKPAVYSSSVRGNARAELENADESARESEYDQGYRMNAGKIEVTDLDRAISSLDDNISPWEQYLDNFPTRENPNAGGYTGGHTKAKVTAVVTGIRKIQDALREAKRNRDKHASRFDGNYDIMSDRRLGKVRPEAERSDYAVEHTSNELVKALPVGSTLTILDPDASSYAGIPVVKIADDVWARSTGLASRDWEFFDDLDMTGDDYATGVILPDSPKNDFTEKELNDARQTKERKDRDDKEFDDNWKAHEESLKAKKEAEKAPAAPAKAGQAPLEEGEQFELPLPGIKKQGKRDDKSEAHKKTLDGLEAGDRVSYTNGHDETSTYQKHADGTWDLLDPEDEWEDQSPLEEALTSDEVAARAKRGDLAVETSEQREEAEAAQNRAANERRKKYEPIKPKYAPDADQGKSRAEQEAQDANSADKPWSVDEIQGTMRDWFDFAQAVKNGDTRAVETMANNKRTGDEETDIIVNDKGQPVDVTLTYNDDGDPVVRLSNFDDSKDIYGDFEIDSSVMPKHLATLIHESINADDISAAVAERNGSNEPSDDEPGQSYQASKYVGYGKGVLTRAMEENPDSGIVINGTDADITDLDKAQDFLHDLVNDIQRRISADGARKGLKIDLNRAQRDINAVLQEVNSKQFQRDGVIRPPKWARDEPVAEAEAEAQDLVAGEPERVLPSKEDILAASPSSLEDITAGSRSKYSEDLPTSGPGLTKVQQDAMTKYMLHGEPINKAASGRDQLTPEVAERIAAIDQTIAESRTKTPFTAYRAFASDPERLQKSLDEGMFTGSSYNSSSMDQAYADSWGSVHASDPNKSFVMLEIKTPEGFTAHAIDYPNEHKNLFGQEQEVLFPRGTSFKIESTEEYTNSAGKKGTRAVVTPVLTEENHFPGEAGTDTAATEEVTSFPLDRPMYIGKMPWASQHRLEMAVSASDDPGLEKQDEGYIVTDAGKAEVTLKPVVSGIEKSLADYRTEPHQESSVVARYQNSIEDFKDILADIQDAREAQERRQATEAAPAEESAPEAAPEVEAPAEVSGPKEWSRGFVTMKTSAFDALPIGTRVKSIGTFAKALIDGVEHHAVTAEKTEKGWMAATSYSENGKWARNDEPVLFPTDAFEQQGYNVLRVPKGALDAAPWTKFDGNMDGLEPGDYIKLRNGKQGIFTPRKNGKPAFAVDDYSDVPKISGIAGPDSIVSVSSVSSRNSKDEAPESAAPSVEESSEPALNDLGLTPEEYQEYLDKMLDADLEQRANDPDGGAGFQDEAAEILQRGQDRLNGVESTPEEAPEFPVYTEGGPGRVASFKETIKAIRESGVESVRIPLSDAVKKDWTPDELEWRFDRDEKKGLQNFHFDALPDEFKRFKDRSAPADPINLPEEEESEAVPAPSGGSYDMSKATSEQQEKLDELDKRMADAVASEDIDAYTEASDEKFEVMQEVKDQPEEAYKREAPITISPEDQAKLDEYNRQMEEAVAADDEEAFDKASDAYQDLMDTIGKQNKGTAEVLSTDDAEEEPWVNPLDALGIERRTPEAIEGETYAPTQQQQDVIDAVLAGLDTKVQAMAGTGKTSTLVALSRRLTKEGKQAVYIAFNKTVQEEAEERMKGLKVEAKTGHGTAHTWARTKIPEIMTRFDGQDPTKPIKFDKKGNATDWADMRAVTSSRDIAAQLGVTGEIREESGVHLTKGTAVLAVKKTVGSFQLSDKDEISVEHVPDSFEIDEKDKPKIVEWAKAYWDDLSRPDGVFRVEHDTYRKHWALSRPDLTDGSGGNLAGASVLYIDEAQDTPPVLAKVVADQKMQKVIVGDRNQAIYAFAENIDYLSEADGDVELPLDKSWRFGPEVADAGNRFLEMLGSDARVVGGGAPSNIVYGMENADAVLVRTNAGMIQAILDESKRDRKVSAPKGTRSDLSRLADNVADLMAGDAPENPHDDLLGFKNWGEVMGALASGDRSVSKIVSMFDEPSPTKRGLIENYAKFLEDKMADVRKAIDSLVMDVPKFNTIKKVKEGNRTYLEPTDAVDENGVPILKPNKREYAVLDFSSELGKLRKPWAAKNSMKFFEKNKAWHTEGGIGKDGWRFDMKSKRWYTDDESVANSIDRYSGEHDVVVSTAHKSKGLEWDRVRIGDDFRYPYEDKTGAMVWPDDDEYKLSYVAVTRAAKELDPGILDFVYQYTKPNGGDPKKRQSTEDSAPAPEQVEEENLPTNIPDEVADEETDVPEYEAPSEVVPEPEAEPESVVETPAPVAEPEPAPAPVAPAPEPEPQEAPEVTPDLVDAPEPVSEPEPVAPVPAPSSTPAPEFDDEGLSPQERRRANELERWINEVYRFGAAGNVEKMENELFDLLERGEKRLNPEKPVPVSAPPARASTSVPKNRAPRGTYTDTPLMDTDGKQIQMGDMVGHPRLGPVAVTGFVPHSGRITFIDPTTGKEASVKAAIVKIVNPEMDDEITEIVGQPGERFQDPATGKKAFYNGNGQPIVTGQRVVDPRTGRTGVVVSVYPGADGLASVPVQWDDAPKPAKPTRVKGILLELAGV
jgi:hypothetical protein